MSDKRCLECGHVMLNTGYFEHESTPNYCVPCQEKFDHINDKVISGYPKDFGDK